MEDRCPLCWRRRAEGAELCEYHQRAHLNLENALEHWQTGLKIGRREYLRQVSSKDETGEWAKEVARYLLEKK